MLKFENYKGVKEKSWPMAKQEKINSAKGDLYVRIKTIYA